MIHRVTEKEYDKIKHLYNDKKLSTRQVGKIVGYSPQTVCNVVHTHNWEEWRSTNKICTQSKLGTLRIELCITIKTLVVKEE